MTDKYMKMGASDLFFFYALTGRSTINEIEELTFKEPFDLAVMKKAAADALRCVPEFNKRIVLRNGRPKAVTVCGDIAFIPEEENKFVHLGSDETNGLLFYFRYTGKRLVFSVFHGLTDGTGMSKFVRTVIYFYMKRMGLALTPDEEAEITKGLRITEGIPPDADSDDVFTPYEKWGAPSAEPEWRYDNPGAFAIPENAYTEECDYIHLCRAEASLSQLKAARDEAGVSYLPYLADAVSTAVSKTYSSGDKPIVAMSGIDQRPNLGSDTMVNCSDSIFFPFTPELRKKDMKERCAKLKEIMKRQFENALHKKMAGEKVLTVRELEKDPAGAAVVAKRLELLPSGDNFTPMTYVLTFIGDLSMGKAANRILDDVRIYNTARACFVIISFYGDKLHITVGNRSDCNDFADSIVKELRERGINAAIVSDSRFYGDKFQYETIKTVNESEEQL